MPVVHRSTNRSPSRAHPIVPVFQPTAPLGGLIQRLFQKSTMNRREWLAASSTPLAAACARPSESAISSKNAPAERLDIPTLLQLASVPGMAIATVHDRASST
jgi:hypothetical protein